MEIKDSCHQRSNLTYDPLRKKKQVEIILIWKSFMLHHRLLFKYGNINKNIPQELQICLSLDYAWKGNQVSNTGSDQSLVVIVCSTCNYSNLYILRFLSSDLNYEDCLYYVKHSIDCLYFVEHSQIWFTV